MPIQWKHYEINRTFIYFTYLLTYLLKQNKVDVFTVGLTIYSNCPLITFIIIIIAIQHTLAAEPEG
jgi:hypothetical protein